MKSIQIELNPIQKGQNVFVFFGKINFDSDIMASQHIGLGKGRTTGEELIAYGICHEKEWAMDLGIGAILKIDEKAYFKVISKNFMPFSALPICVLQCLRDLPNAELKILPKITEGSGNSESNKENSKESSLQSYSFEYTKNCHNLAIITLSDKGFTGKRVDESAPAISKLINSKIKFGEERYFILPDDATALKGLVATLAYTQGFDCIITTGGTGLSERDVTPNALLPMLDQRLYGFEQAMMAKSLEKTPTAMLSRAFCGIINKTILISVPGSVKASTENIEAILSALPHALAKLNGDMSDCARL